MKKELIITALRTYLDSKIPPFNIDTIVFDILEQTLSLPPLASRQLPDSSQVRAQLDTIENQNADLTVNELRSLIQLLVIHASDLSSTTQNLYQTLVSSIEEFDQTNFIFQMYKILHQHGLLQVEFVDALSGLDCHIDVDYIDEVLALYKNSNWATQAQPLTTEEINAIYKDPNSAMLLIEIATKLINTNDFTDEVRASLFELIQQSGLNTNNFNKLKELKKLDQHLKPLIIVSREMNAEQIRDLAQGLKFLQQSTPSLSEDQLTKIIHTYATNRSFRLAITKSQFALSCEFPRKDAGPLWILVGRIAQYDVFDVGLLLPVFVQFPELERDFLQILDTHRTAHCATAINADTLTQFGTEMMEYRTDQKQGGFRKLTKPIFRGFTETDFKNEQAMGYAVLCAGLPEQQTSAASLVPVEVWQQITDLAHETQPPRFIGPAATERVFNAAFSIFNQRREEAAQAASTQHAPGNAIEQQPTSAPPIPLVLTTITNGSAMPAPEFKK